MTSTVENGDVGIPEPVKFDLNSDLGVTDLEDVEVAYAGMPKETLLKFSQTPFWNRFRRITMWIFWLLWLGLIGTVIGLTVTYKGCRVKPNLQWWQKDAVYQIYPRSFKDSNGDGVGDIKGIESKLGYLAELGVGIIWLNSVYQSPMKDQGYDVTDHKKIDATYGTMDDFDSLLEKIHEMGMKLIVDFIPNHTSDKHHWFNESRKSNDPNNPYRNYYVWKNCNDTTPPNNWLDVYGNSSWTYDSQRGQCYYHHFLPSQPDLNLRNNKVKQELDEILRFWLSKNIDGIHVHAPGVMFEDYDLRDEAEDNQPVNSDKYNTLIHNYTKNLNEVFELITRWRGVLQESSSDSYRFMVSMSQADADILEKYYGPTGGSGVDATYNYDLVGSLNRSCNGKCVSKLVQGHARNRWPNWAVGNQDSERVASKMGDNFVNAVNMLMLMLPGTPTTYYGEEIGMTNHNNISEPRDPLGVAFPGRSRDPFRTPMQWNITQTDLPVNINSSSTVEGQESDSYSHLNIYKKLMALRKDGGLTHDEITYIDRDDNVFSFYRTWDGQTRFLIAINFGNADAGPVDFTTPENYMVSKSVVDSASVAVATHQSLVNSKVDSLTLAPGEGVVFQWNYELPYLMN